MSASDVSRFEVTCVEDAGAFIVSVSGEVDLATASEFEAAVAAGADKPGALIVDLTDCGFMDSTGISVLVRARSQPPGQEGRLALVIDPGGPVARLLRLAADGLFDVYTTRAAALAAKAG